MSERDERNREAMNDIAEKLTASLPTRSVPSGPSAEDERRENAAAYLREFITFRPGTSSTPQREKAEACLAVVLASRAPAGEPTEAMVEAGMAARWPEHTPPFPRDFPWGPRREHTRYWLRAALAAGAAPDDAVVVEFATQAEVRAYLLGLKRGRGPVVAGTFADGAPDGRAPSDETDISVVGTLARILATIRSQPGNTRIDDYSLAKALVARGVGMGERRE